MSLGQQISPFLESIDEEVLANLHGRSMLLTDEWTRDEIDAVCNVASALEMLDRRGIPTQLLQNELHYALFFDNSTRTKSSWAGASVRLGGTPMVVDGSSTQVAHGETAEETGAMLGMNAHALGIRHDLILGVQQVDARRRRRRMNVLRRFASPLCSGHERRSALRDRKARATTATRPAKATFLIAPPGREQTARRG